jgi:hypothetical protein
MLVTPSPRVPRTALIAVQGIPVNRVSIPGGFQLPFSGARVPFLWRKPFKIKSLPILPLFWTTTCIIVQDVPTAINFVSPLFSSRITLTAYSHWFRVSVFRLQPSLVAFLRVPQVFARLHDSPPFHVFFSVRNFALATSDCRMPSRYNCIVTGSALQSRDYIDCMVQQRHRCDGWGAADNY